MTNAEAKGLQVKWNQQVNPPVCAHSSLELEGSDIGYLTGNHHCVDCGTFFLRSNLRRHFPRPRRLTNACRGEQSLCRTPRSSITPLPALSCRVTSLRDFGLDVHRACRLRISTSLEGGSPPHRLAEAIGADRKAPDRPIRAGAIWPRHRCRASQAKS